jgi:hypothetical protein
MTRAKHLRSFTLSLQPEEIFQLRCLLAHPDNTEKTASRLVAKWVRGLYDQKFPRGKMTSRVATAREIVEIHLELLAAEDDARSAERISTVLSDERCEVIVAQRHVNRAVNGYYKRKAKRTDEQHEL